MPKCNPKYDDAFEDRPDIKQVLNFSPYQTVAAPRSSQLHQCNLHRKEKERYKLATHRILNLLQQEKAKDKKAEQVTEPTNSNK